MPTDIEYGDKASPAGTKSAVTDALEAAHKAVEDTAAIGGGLWLSYLFVLFYLGIAAFGVTHADLLLQTPVKLPFLNIELPLLPFFFLAPLLLLLTHAYTLVHLVLLARRVAQFNAIEGPSEAWRRRLPSNIFVQFLGAPEEDPYVGFGSLLAAILWVTLVIAPIALYLLLEIQFLPYHSWWITWTTRVALIVDLVLLWWLWGRILAVRARRQRARAWKTVAALRALRTLLVVLLVVLSAWGVATIPGEFQEDHLPAKFALTWARERLFDGGIDPITRRRTSWFSNTLVLPAFNLNEALKIDDPKKVEWKQTLIDLRGRDLNGAMFFAATLNKADFSGAHLHGASLAFAQLRGASFDYAQLQGALLGGAQLQGAYLVGAQLQGASLVAAQLQGASLDGAQLQGASFDYAQLQGASLADTALWRARLTNSVAKDLYAPPGSPDWSPRQVDLGSDRRQPWTDATYAKLRGTIEQTVPEGQNRVFALFPEGQNRDLALLRVAILDCARKGGDLASCDPSAEPPDAVKKSKKMIEAKSVDPHAYSKALAAILGGLVCSNEGDRIYVLRGLLGSFRYYEIVAEMPALVKRITSSECPVSTALTAADKRSIATALSRPLPIRWPCYTAAC